jgi:hypothetical protein
MLSRRHVPGLLLALAGPVPASSQQVTDSYVLFDDYRVMPAA